ncbi:MAG: transglycosylase SLT domain-containing protein [Cyclobacteriaceae bacterium]|nr:transglycosylase SLT domain-containing protein [Cyclobacteriaceae bacterium]MCH8517106.1 transglycosylase SLT domain-containing protein [Cyclobacteriaceae bacterium]
MYSHFRLLLFFIAGALASAILIYQLNLPGTAKTEKQTAEEDTTYQIPIFKTPDHMKFCGEEVPLHLPDVRERLDRELHVNAFWHSSTIHMMKRSGRYLPQIEQFLSDRNLPDDLKYLPMVESGFMNLVSPRGAAGFWQIMEATGKEYGLEINSEVDERYDLNKSGEVAALYLIKARNKFGSWTSAIASYNMGMNGLDRQFAKQQVGSYYDLLLNEETSRYVFRMLALKLIFENPQKYGFDLEKDDFNAYHQTKTIKIDQSLPNLADFALEQGINYKTLKNFNPWLRDNKLTVVKNTYEIKVPTSPAFQYSQE